MSRRIYEGFAHAAVPKQEGSRIVLERVWEVSGKGLGGFWEGSGGLLGGIKGVLEGAWCQGLLQVRFQ